MGFCCSKSAMPVVDDSGHQHRHVESAVVAPAVPTVDFDVILPEGSHGNGFNFTVSGNGFTALDQSVCTMSEGSTSQPDPQAQSLSMTTRDDLNRSFITNGMNEVLTGHIDQFVNGVLQMSMADPHNMLEESFCASTLRGSNRARASVTTLASSDTLTRDQQRYLNNAADLSERIARLVELEMMSRQEIFGAWRMNTALIQLATKRIMPTIRQRRAPPKVEGEKTRKNVLVIHAKDIDVEFDDESPPRNKNSQSNGTLFSPPDTKRSKETKEGKEAKEQPQTVEHYQLLALTAREVSLTANVQAQVVNDTWDFLSIPNATNHLNSGNVFFRFVCSPVGSLPRDSLELIDSFINYSSFEDEVRENNTPKVNIYDGEAQQKYVSILVKAMYLLPGARLANVTPELMSSLDYQRNCQPGENKFEEPDLPNTFRTIKTIIKFVFSITIQMKVSEITDPDALQSFKNVDGMVPAKVLMLERTKKNIQKTDSTVKVRSLLLYYPVNDGILVNNQTIVLNSSLPRVVSSLMQTFGSQGAAEAAQTAKQTRQYMIRRFGDSRS